MKISRALLLTTSSAALACFAASSAFADDGAAASSPNQLQEIVVTAQKTSEAASKVPLALSVFKGEELQEKGIIDVSKLDEVAPGLLVTSAAHGVSITLRGATNSDPTSKGTQDVAFSVDGVPIGRPQEVGTAFFDLDRIEVVRGPVGTLYGMSSTAGAINVIPNLPKDHFDASSSFEIGNYDTKRFNGMVNLPITDTIAVRLAVNTNNREGFMNPVLGTSYATPTSEAKQSSEDNWTARFTALWNFSPNGRLMFTYTGGRISGPDSTTQAIYSQLHSAHGSHRFDIYQNPMVGDSGDNDNWENYAVHLDYDAGPVHIAYVGARMIWAGNDDYSPSTGNPVSNAGNAPAGYPNAQGFNWSDYQSHVDTDSHELRLSNSKPQQLEWIVGANFWQEHNQEVDANWSTLVGAPGELGTPCPTPSLTAGCNFVNPYIVGPDQHKTQGVFATTTYHVNDAFKVIAGARFTSDSMYRNATFAGGPAPPSGWLNANGTLCGPLNGACVGPTGTGGVLNDNGSEKATKVTWRLGGEYQLSPSDMVYATVSTGYKAGGFNDYSVVTHGTSAFAPESNTNYEVGYKGRPLSNLRLTTDVYFTDYSKYQVTQPVFIAGAANISAAPFVVINTVLAPATMIGWESSATWQATPNDRLNLDLTLQNATYDKGANELGIGFNFYGQKLPWGGHTLDTAPTFAANVGYDHDWTLSNGARLTFHVNSKISSRYNETNFGFMQAAPFGPPGVVNVLFPNAYPPTLIQKSFTRSDLQLSYETADGKYKIDAFVHNLEDKVQILSPDPGNGTVRINLPRTEGLRLSMKY